MTRVGKDTRNAPMFDEQARTLITYALRHPRGRYAVERTSQLSGIPRSTLYEWRQSHVYVPDFVGASPAAWSYRDLIWLRVLARLRQGGMARRTAAQQVRRIKNEVAKGRDLRYVHATRTELLVEPETTSRTSGENLLPFDDIYEYIRVFDLHDPIEELRQRGVRRLWAPNLVKPSPHTAISPWSLAGDPYVERTRIPTASIYALRADRGLDHGDIVELYPGLTIDAAQDADQLERRLRGIEPPESLAA